MPCETRYRGPRTRPSRPACPGRGRNGRNMGARTRNIAAHPGDVPCVTPLDLTPDQLLSTTRAVRKRLDLSRPVERELLQECLDLAFQAPTGGNVQGWHFLLVTEVGRKRAISDLYHRSKRENDPSSTPPEHQRSMDSSAYLAEHLHEVPV